MFVTSPNKKSASLSDETKMRNKPSNISSETESLGESDSSTTVSVSMSGGSTYATQRVVRWSKFVRNLYEMAVNPENERAVGFSDDGLCLEIRDSKYLSSEVLQKYFKHKNVSSFIRQLNNYGFKTVPIIMSSSISQCFAHDCFQRGRLDLLEGVTRRTAGSDAQKVGERISALREKETEFEERMINLKRMNDQLIRQNNELQEENKRLKANWLVVQDSLKGRAYDQQPQLYQQQQYIQQQPRRVAHPAPVIEPMPFGSIDTNPNEMFLLPNASAFFPEEF